ncbi:MAG: tetratricopeptide repeat protein [Pyrinomonadaceae bacterium]
MSTNKHSRAVASLLAACAVMLSCAQARAVQNDSQVRNTEAHAAESASGWRGRPLEELRGERRREPSSPLANYNLGAALYEAGRYEEAAGFLTRAAELDQTFAAPRRTLGLAYFKLARYGEAAAAFRELTRVSPRLAEGHNNLGVAYAKAGKHKEAVAALAEAVRLEPAYAEARFNLGAALVELSERAAAAEQYAALLPLDAVLAGRLFRLIHRDKLVDADSR